MWFSTHEWFRQVSHIFEFDDLETLKDFRINASQDKQWGALRVYSLATLEVVPNKMPEFIEKVRKTTRMFPIIASWQPVAGNPNEVNDIWKEAINPRDYQPVVESIKE